MSAGEPVASSPRILVVDDNSALAENLVEILQDAGYQVRSTHSCASAEEAMAAGLDVALVDLKLPDGDGSKLAMRLKERNPDCEVILLTGFASVESAAAAVRSGAWAYLVKPCATPDLLVTVEQALRQVRQHAEKRELARRAQVAEKLAAVGTLTAGLSHEIRNPLNAAVLQLSVLERRVRKLAEGSQGPLLEPLTLVRDEIRRLDHILEDFLQFARPVQFVAKPVEVQALLERVAAFLGTDAERRNVALECAGSAVKRVAGDEGRLRQVVMNLALNALDAAGEGGRVRLSCEPDGGFVRLQVDDSGPGISPELADRIFEPFFTTKAKGSGLGLPIVHAIVSQHGGTIALERSPLGGARFSVRIPVGG